MVLFCIGFGKEVISLIFYEIYNRFAKTDWAWHSLVWSISVEYDKHRFIEMLDITLIAKSSVRNQRNLERSLSYQFWLVLNSVVSAYQETEKSVKQKISGLCGATCALSAEISFDHCQNPNAKAVTRTIQNQQAKHPKSCILVNMYATCSDSWSDTYAATSRLQEF